MSEYLIIHLGQRPQGQHLMYTITCFKQNGRTIIPYRSFGSVIPSDTKKFLIAQARSIVAFCEGKRCTRLQILNGSEVSESGTEHRCPRIPNDIFFVFYLELDLIAPKK